MKHHTKANQYGRLFVFEGPDDVGKTTLANMLYDYLSRGGHPTELLSFPGNEQGTLGELVYRLYHDPVKFGLSKVSPIAMQLVVTAAHVEVIETRIKPLLRTGINVVLDRFWWSTWVYSSVEGVPQPQRDKLIEIELLSWEDIKPAALLLILRDGPFLDQPSNYPWHHILSLYKDLFNSQQGNVNAMIIVNDRGIEEAFQSALSYVK